MSYRVKMILPVVGMFLLGCAVVAAVRSESRGIKHPFPESSAPLTAFAGGTFEASGVAHVPGTDGVLFVDDGREDEIFWMRLGEGRKQAGAIKPVKLGASVIDLEGITTDGTHFYVVGSQFMRAVTYLGSNEFLVVAGACVVLAFVLARRGRAAVTILITMVGATLLNVTLKLSFGRGRPEPFFGAPLPESYSFPSGHALLSFCFYGVVAAAITARVKGTGRRASVWAVAVLLVALIGLSRVYLGVHYPSDVAAGYAAAFVWLVTVASADRVVEARLRQKTDSFCRNDH